MSLALKPNPVSEFAANAEVSQGPFVVGQSGDITVNAKYYAGGGLPNAEVTWNVTRSDGAFRPPNRDEYVFGKNDEGPIRLWRRPNGNYDLYVMDIATHALVELTRDAGRNERPSWAPDGRHIIFESTRTGTRQIWSMLADGSNVRQLTTEGQNESPNWSPK